MKEIPALRNVTMYPMWVQWPGVGDGTQQMHENKYLHLPVVDEDTGIVQGVVSVMEIVQATAGSKGSSRQDILDTEHFFSDRFFSPAMLFPDQMPRARHACVLNCSLEDTSFTSYIPVGWQNTELVETG